MHPTTSTVNAWKYQTQDSLGIHDVLYIQDYQLEIIADQIPRIVQVPTSRPLRIKGVQSKQEFIKINEDLIKRIRDMTLKLFDFDEKIDEMNESDLLELNKLQLLADRNSTQNLIKDEVASLFK